MAEILDPKDRIDDLLFIAGHLIDILEQENAALAKNDLAVISTLVDQKTKLSRAYEIRVLGMEKSDQGIASVEPALIEKLKIQSEHLQGLVETNERVLKVNIETGKRFMTIVADSVRSSTPTAGTYGSNGKSDAPLNSTKTRSASIAIDENL
ncbi:MAG: hypothetical protein JKY92_00710 [Magnetovibrio sp.]|nr:hypothetical protein [Magnetovibrio sp.]